MVLFECPAVVDVTLPRALHHHAILLVAPVCCLPTSTPTASLLSASASASAAPPPLGLTLLHPRAFILLPLQLVRKLGIGVHTPRNGTTGHPLAARVRAPRWWLTLPLGAGSVGVLLCLEHPSQFSVAHDPFATVGRRDCSGVRNWPWLLLWPRLLRRRWLSWRRWLLGGRLLPSCEGVLLGLQLPG